jgi:hypothetical protein
MPAVMIDKCAQVAALRLAFPDQFQGLYAAEEMGNAGEVAETLQAKPMPIQEVQFVEMMSEQQEAMLQEQAATLAEMRGVSFDDVVRSVYASKAVQAAGAQQGDELTAEQADVALSVLARWIEQARAKAQPDAVQVAMEQAKAASIESGMASEDIAF